MVKLGTKITLGSMAANFAYRAVTNAMSNHTGDHAGDRPLPHDDGQDYLGRCSQCGGKIVYEMDTCAEHNQRVADMLALAHDSALDHVEVVYRSPQDRHAVEVLHRQMSRFLAETGYVQRYCASLNGWAPQPLTEYTNPLPHCVIHLDRESGAYTTTTATDAFRRGIITTIHTPSGDIDRACAETMTS